MPIHGSLDEASLPDVLQLLSLGKKTGCLSLTEGTLEGQIFLDAGRVCHATVTSRKDRLGDILVKRGRITHEQLSAAVERQGRARRKSVGQVLIESGQIDRTELEKFVQGQVEEAVYFLFTWRNGDFTFTGNVRPKGQDFLVSIDPESLLLEGARRVDEWSEIAKKIPSLELVYRLEKDPRQATNAALSEAQLRIIPLIDGARDVRGIVEATGMVEFDVGKALYGLITAGFAKLVDRRVRVRHLEYRELLAYLVHEAEFADPAKRREAGRHILDCPACAASLKKIHVSRTQEFATSDVPAATPEEPEEAAREDAAAAPTVETPRAGLQDRVVMKSASDMLMPAEAVETGPEEAKPAVERRRGQRRSGSERRRGIERRQAASQDWPPERERRSGHDRRRSVQRRVVEQRRSGDRRAALARADRSTPGGGAAVAATALAAVPQRTSGRRTDPRRRSTGPRHASEPRHSQPTPADPPSTPTAEAPPAGPQVATPDVVSPAAPDVKTDAPVAQPPAASADPETPAETVPAKERKTRQRGPGTGRTSEISWLVTPDESDDMIRSSRATASPVAPADPPRRDRPGTSSPASPAAREPHAPPEPIQAEPKGTQRKRVATKTVARSVAAAAAPPAARQIPPPAPAPVPARAAQPQPRSAVAKPAAGPVRRASGGRWIALAAAVAIVAGLAWGVTSVIGSSGSPSTGIGDAGRPLAQPANSPEREPSQGVTESANLGAAVPGAMIPSADSPAPAPTPREPEQVGGGQPAGQPATAEPPAPARIQQPPAPRVLLAGTVLDAVTNDPLVGVQITIPATGATAVSGPSGTFEFTDPPVGDVAVVARFAGYQERRAATRVDPRRGGQVILALQPVPPPAQPAPQPVVTPPVSPPRQEPAPQPEPADREPPSEPVQGPPTGRPAETDPELINGTWVRVSRAEAREILGRDIVAVPGLPVESVAKPGTSARSGVRIAQTLDTGDRLELVVTRPPFLSRAGGRPGEDDRISAVRVADPSSPGGTATGTARLGSYLVTAKAVLTASRLRDLLNRLESPSP